MTTLQEARSRILGDPNPAGCLEVADDYLDRAAKLKTAFVLPVDHAAYRPVVEHYTTDLAGWKKFVIGIRDRLPEDTPQRKTVQEFLGKVRVRLEQRERRDRLRAVTSMAIKMRLIADVREVKLRYQARCTRKWVEMKNAMLASARGKGKKGKITLEERYDLLDEFWQTIDEGIEKGIVPEP